jgi:hypothetical protein
METKHTPQPWDLFRTPEGVLYIVLTVHEGFIETVTPGPHAQPDLRRSPDMDEDEFVGNVLALPDLVEYGSAVLEIIRSAQAKLGVQISDASGLSHIGYAGVLGQFRKALARATGQP